MNNRLRHSITSTGERRTCAPNPGLAVLTLLLIVASLIVGVSRATAQSIVSSLSQDNVSITATFDGSQIFIFGAVKSNIMPDVNAGPLDVIIEVAGPPAQTLSRKKVHKFGIWINSDAVSVGEAPSFYSLASTRPIDEILSLDEQKTYGIGLGYAITANPEVDPEYEAAVIRVRENNGTYIKIDDPVKLAEETLFSTKVDMPSNVVEGDYTANIYLIRAQKVVASSHSPISVRKTGLESWLYNLAHQQPLIYAVMSLLVALAAGYLASAAFRLFKR